ncbi:MAG: AAA family ATPase [Tateyamaria sp.]|uniref:AAA family ATPase n=1 Tax=Tateyamaria sp. TaxID=1929288 RepID=UPI00329046BE
MNDTHKPDEEDERQAALELIKQYSSHVKDGFDDLFEGWDHIDIALVRDAIIGSATKSEIRDALSWKNPDKSDEPWCVDTYAQFSKVRFRDRHVGARADTALRRCLAVLSQSEFEALKKAMPRIEEKPARPGTYLIDVHSEDDLPRTVSKEFEDIDALLQIRDTTKAGSAGLKAAKALSEKFPNAADVIYGLLSEVRHSMSFGDDTLKFRPTIIVGKPGIGKTTVVRALCGALGVEPYIVSVAGHSDANIFGVSAGWSTAMPSIMTIAVLRQKVTNPVLVLDEIDKVRPSHNGDIFASLLSLTEPVDARTYRDKFLTVNTDCSKMSWVFTANDLSKIPEPLKDRCVVYKMHAPSQDQLPQIIRSMRDDYARERKVDPRFMPLFPDDYQVIAHDFQKRSSLRRSREMMRLLVNMRQSNLPRA